MATFVEKLQLVIESINQDAVRGLKDTAKASDELGGSTSRLDNALGKVGLSGKVTGEQLKGAMIAGAAGAGAAIAGFAIKGIQDFENLGQSVLKFQRIAGTTAEESSRWVALLDDYQVEAEAGAAAIGKMAKAAETSPDKFAEFGVAIAKNTDGTTDLQQTLLNAADAYKATEDPAKRAALGAALFGKSYQQLVPILEQGSAAIRESFDSTSKSQILSQDQLQKSEDFRLAMDNLNDSIGGLQRGLGEGLIPAVTNVVTEVSQGIETVDKWTRSIGGLASVVKGVANQVAFGNPFGSFRRDIIDVDAIMAHFAKETMPSATSAERDLEKAATDLTAANTGLRREVENQTAALKEKIAATKDAIKAEGEQLDATLASFDAEMKTRKAHNDTIAAVKELAKAKGKDLIPALDEAAAKALDEAQAFADLWKAQDEAEGKTQSVAERQGVMRDALITIRDELAPDNPLRVRLDEYIDALNNVPTKVSTLLELQAVASKGYADIISRGGGDNIAPEALAAGQSVGAQSLTINNVLMMDRQVVAQSLRQYDRELR